MPESISSDGPLPIQAWTKEMSAAIDRICELGRMMLTKHSGNEKAAAVAKEWKLAERLDDEEKALHELFRRARAIIESIEVVRLQMARRSVDEPTLHQAMRDAVHAIHEHLPEIEHAFLVSRHSALDLLRWTDRSGYLDGSPLPADYRASYAELVAYTPVFKPRLEKIQHELLALKHRKQVHEDARHFLSALTRYNALADSARAFVKSIVEPPFELVFHDTEGFQDDWQAIDVQHHGGLATEINDCCQLLLYDQRAFDHRVESIDPNLPDGVDASLFVLSIDDWRVIFTVDEDPVFHELRISLLRIVDAMQYNPVIDRVIRELYSGLSDA